MDFAGSGQLQPGDASKAVRVTARVTEVADGPPPGPWPWPDQLAGPRGV